MKWECVFVCVWISSIRAWLTLGLPICPRSMHKLAAIQTPADGGNIYDNKSAETSFTSVTRRSRQNLLSPLSPKLKKKNLGESRSTKDWSHWWMGFSSTEAITPTGLPPGPPPAFTISPRTVITPPRSLNLKSRLQNNQFTWKVKILPHISGSEKTKTIK